MNIQLQDDEVEVLKAIYDSDFKIVDDTQRSYSITVRSHDSPGVSVELLIIYPEVYPMESPPVYELRNAQWLHDRDTDTISENLTRIYQECNGEVVVYQWVEWIREFISEKSVEIMGSAVQEPPTLDEAVLDEDSEEDQSGTQDNSTATLQPQSELRQEEEIECPVIVHGEPLTDRKSTFQAHVAHITSVDEVRVVLKELKNNRKIATATHNILAYRVYDGSRGVLQQDCDDDGEHAAGGRLLHLLQIMDIQNAVVVVTRWYGGIHLHSDRFKHINNVARILLQETTIGQQHKCEQNKSQKTGKGRKR